MMTSCDSLSLGKNPSSSRLGSAITAHLFQLPRMADPWSSTLRQQGHWVFIPRDSYVPLFIFEMKVHSWSKIILLARLLKNNLATVRIVLINFRNSTNFYNVSHSNLYKLFNMCVCLAFCAIIILLSFKLLKRKNTIGNVVVVNCL